MKRYIRRIKKRTTKNEFKRQLKFLIGVTFGFTIAFSWRQTIFDISESLVKFITHIESTATLSIFASIVITLVSLGAIYLSSKWLRDTPSEF